MNISKLIQKKNNLNSKLTINQFDKVMKLFDLDIDSLNLPSLGKNETTDDKFYRNRWVEELKVTAYNKSKNEITLRITGNYLIQNKVSKKDKEGIWRPDKPKCISFEIEQYL